MKRSVVIAAFLFAMSASAQVEHAPTVEQCQADQRLWISKLEATPLDIARHNLPPFDAVSAWDSEMSDCMKVDPKKKIEYYNVASEVHAEEGLRMRNFLKRHGFWDGFKREDAEGKR